MQASRPHVEFTKGVPGRPRSRRSLDNRAPTRRYLKPDFGCLRCNRRGSWASARTHYLQWCPRCSRCNRRSGRRSLLVRSSLLNEFGGMCPELADQLLPAPDADGQRTAPGERADPALRMTVVAAIVRIHDGHGALRWPEGPRRQQPRPHAPGRRRSSWPAARYRPRRIVRLRPGTAPRRPVRPRPCCEHASAGPRSPDHDPVTAAAKTCLRRRNARLPGIIHK
jgi:hypothetical protein